MGDAARILEVEVEDEAGGLRVRFARGAEPVRFGPLWLRDHDQSEAGLHPETLQRRVDTFALPAEPAVVEARPVEGGEAVTCRWRDGATTRHRAPLLWRMAHGAAAEDAPRPWNAERFDEGWPSVRFDAVMSGDAGLGEWLRTVRRDGFCLVRGVPVTPEATEGLCERIGPLRSTIFGTFWDFTADLAHADTAYTREAIPLHTDGTYCADPPGLQLFHCLRFDGEGGHSVLADGLAVAERLRRDRPDAFEVLTNVRIPARYLDDGVHLAARHPVIALDAEGAVHRIAFNNADRAPFRLPRARMAAFYEALRAFAAELERPEHRVRFRLEPGTALLFDNQRVLHAREAFSGERRLCGAYLDRGVFESRLRCLPG